MTIHGICTIVPISTSDLPGIKPIRWLGSSKKDLKTFPAEVQDAMGYALYLAQTNRRDPHASLMKGALRGVLEVRDTDPSGTYRTMYTARFAGVIYVLHAFQKKSKTGIATPLADLNLIARRFADAKRDYTATQSKQGEKP